MGITRLLLAPNIPADNRLPIAFKATNETKTVLMELSRLFADVIGDDKPLNVSATIRACIHFTYERREAIMMARLREQRRKESKQCPTQNDANQNSSSPSSSSPQR